MNTKSFSNPSGNLTQLSENIFLSAERLTPLPIQYRVNRIIEVPLSYALLYDRNDSSNILLRRGSDRSGHYGFAGGKHRAEESSIDCVTREVKEEVGIKIPTHHFVSLGVISIKDSIWSKKQLHAHGYHIPEELQDSRSNIRVAHSRCHIFAAPIDFVDQAPKKYDGHQYKRFDIFSDVLADKLKSRFYPVIETWKSIVLGPTQNFVE